MLWCALCRLHGSYEAIDGGLLADSMSDLTGGCCESYNLALMRNEGLPQNLQTSAAQGPNAQTQPQAARPISQQLYEFIGRVLLDSFDKDSVICCGIDQRDDAATGVNTRGYSNQVLPNGLVCSHAYSLTSVNRVRPLASPSRPPFLSSILYAYSDRHTCATLIGNRRHLTDIV